MEWGRPWALWLFWILVPLTGFLFLDARKRRRDLTRLVGDLAPRLVFGGGRLGLRGGLRLFALGFGLLALADPRWGTKVEELQRLGVDVLFVVDVSRSMTADDVRPTRMAKAKAEIARLAEALKTERLGLIAFSGVADPVVPLTQDSGAFRMFLDLLEPGLVPVPGTDLGEALVVAGKQLGDEDLQYKVIVLVTDGEDHGGKGLAVARSLAAKGVVIHTVLVGDRNAPLPDGQGGFHRDSKGESVLSRPDGEGLAKIATATGGGFYRAVQPRIELGPLAEVISTMEDRELASQEARHLEERYQIPLGLALFFLALELLVIPRERKESRRLV